MVTPKNLYVGRQGISNTLLDTAHMIRTMLANWPECYQIPPDHDLHELLRVMDVVAEELPKEPIPCLNNVNVEKDTPQ